MFQVDKSLQRAGIQDPDWPITGEEPCGARGLAGAGCDDHPSGLGFPQSIRGGYEQTPVGTQSRDAVTDANVDSLLDSERAKPSRILGPRHQAPKFPNAKRRMGAVTWDAAGLGFPLEHHDVVDAAAPQLQGCPQARRTATHDGDRRAQRARHRSARWRGELEIALA